jgi:hypothetical protein
VFCPLRFGGCHQALLEEEAVVSRFENVAAVGKTIELSGLHLRVVKNGSPLAEAQVRLNDDGGGPLTEFAQQMEEQSSPEALNDRQTSSSRMTRSE